ncbi:hypothetical protein [Bradyrhizobium sp. CER78]|uniref:hypothetical protein n=1 Tax=Bradyrhizobium sp. CER78 TaxID=3039162 RepID=UPI00244C1E26|nr:hypothetical protein [Bradyrhizobium sp. CER78]MDH2383734.1 hypothetical protein [Bradyrhizobium sp. CER78]
MAEAARIRGYRSSDADEVNRLAIAAFDQFRDAFDDWPAMRAGLSRTSELSSGGETIVADLGDRLAGASAISGPASKRPHSSIRHGRSFACWSSTPSTGARDSGMR